MDNTMVNRGIGDLKEKIGNKKEGKVPQAGHTFAEAMRIETLGQITPAGKGKLSFKEGGHTSSGKKINLKEGKHGEAKGFPRM